MSISKTENKFQALTTFNILVTELRKEQNKIKQKIIREIKKKNEKIKIKDILFILNEKHLGLFALYKIYFRYYPPPQPPQKK